MNFFFILSKFLSPFLVPLGLLNLSFWLLFLSGKHTPRRLWATWGIVFWILCMPLTASLLLGAWETPLSSPQSLAPGSYDAIVILGGMVEGQTSNGQWSLGESVDRLTEALRLFKKGVASRLLVTGGDTGVVSARDWTEAQIMAEFLVVMGVPAEVILLEDQAQNTYQNALFSRPLLELAGAEKALLITSAFHMRRSLATFRQQDMDVTPYSVDSRLIETDWLLRLLPNPRSFGTVNLVLREIIGYFVYWLVGYL